MSQWISGRSKRQGAGLNGDQVNLGEKVVHWGSGKSVGDTVVHLGSGNSRRYSGSLKIGKI